VAKARPKPPAAEDYCFGPQLDLVNDPAKFKTAVCSRRAGKSVGCAFALVDSALRRPGSVSMYLTLDRTDAKQIVWPAVLDVNDKYRLGGKADHTDLTLSLPNKATVLLAGAGDERKIKKRRGLPIGMVIVDEAQSFTEEIRTLVDDVLAPALQDYDGSMWIIGTPGPVPVGFFYEAANSPAWSHHAWTAFQNPWIEKKSGKTPRQHLEAELARRGLTEDAPSIQREWFGRWVYDPNALVFRYSAERNHYRDLPACRAEWQYVIGVDLGYDDADAIAVLAFNEESPNAYLVEEWTQAGLTVSGLTAELQQCVDKYHPLSIVVDTGGLGKKVAKEVTLRSGVPLKAAEKDRKFEFIELLNDAMRTGRFYAKSGGRFAQDCMLVEWDRSKPETMKVSDRYHSDLTDACLYAFRESLHWLHEPAKPPPTVEQWHSEQESAMLAEMEAQIESQKRDEQEVWG